MACRINHIDAWSRNSVLISMQKFDFHCGCVSRRWRRHARRGGAYRLMSGDYDVAYRAARSGSAIVQVALSDNLISDIIRDARRSLPLIESEGMMMNWDQNLGHQL
jgi:hypothetical protein